MKIRELPCLLLMLLPVFVGQVHQMQVITCPRECTRKEETLTCHGITNDALPNLYKCVNEFPDIQVIDIRSSIMCDCSLLYLTNHHVNPDLLVFAPVTCPHDTVAACGFDNFKKKTDVLEIAGKIFKIEDDNLYKQVDKHVKKLVKKLGQVQNTKKRLMYIYAIFLSTKKAVGKLTLLQENLYPESTSSSESTTSTPTSTQGVKIPRHSSDSNPFISIYKIPHLLSSNTAGYVRQPHNQQEAYPLPVHVFHHGPADNKKVKSKLPVHLPYNKELMATPQPTTQPTTQRTTSTVQSTKSIKPSHRALTRKRPHTALHGLLRKPFIPYYRRRILPGYWPSKGSHKKRLPASEQESWYNNPYNFFPGGPWYLATTSTAATTTESLAEEIRQNDTRMKLIIFGSIIAFVLLVITITLVIINGGKDGDEDNQRRGDLDLKSFKKTITLWKQLKGKMQVDYRRRETTGKHTTPSRKTSSATKEAEIVSHSLQNIPLTNLLQTTGSDAAAVSGLTTAMAQQPTLKDTTTKSERKIDKLNKMKPTRPLGPDGFQTRLIYRDHGHNTKSFATVAHAVMDKSDSKMAPLKQPTGSFNSNSSSIKNSEIKKSQSNQKAKTTNKEEQKNVAPESSEEGLFASNLMKKVEPTEVRDDQALKSRIFVDKTFGTPTSTDGQSDNLGARQAVKTFQPISQELGRGGRLMGVGDNKYFEVTCTFMDFQERERSRALRKKKLARSQFLA